MNHHFRVFFQHLFQDIRWFTALENKTMVEIQLIARFMVFMLYRSFHVDLALYALIQFLLLLDTIRRTELLFLFLRLRSLSRAISEKIYHFNVLFRVELSNSVPVDAVRAKFWQLIDVQNCLDIHYRQFLDLLSLIRERADDQIGTDLISIEILAIVYVIATIGVFSVGLQLVVPKFLLFMYL